MAPWGPGGLHLASATQQPPCAEPAPNLYLLIQIRGQLQSHGVQAREVRLMRNKSSGELSFPVPSPSAGQPPLPSLPLASACSTPSLPCLPATAGNGQLGGTPLLLFPSSHSPHSYGQQPLGTGLLGRGCSSEPSLVFPGPGPGPGSGSRDPPLWDSAYLRWKHLPICSLPSPFFFFPCPHSSSYFSGNSI